MAADICPYALLEGMEKEGPQVWYQGECGEADFKRWKIVLGMLWVLEEGCFESCGLLPPGFQAVQ